MVGRCRPFHPAGAASCSRGRRSEAEFAGDVAGGAAEEVGDVDAQVVEQAGVLVGVDLVGELLLGLGGLVVLTELGELGDDLLLVDLNASPVDGAGWV